MSGQKQPAKFHLKNKQNLIIVCDRHFIFFFILQMLYGVVGMLIILKNKPRVQQPWPNAGMGGREVDLVLRHEGLRPYIW